MQMLKFFIFVLLAMSLHALDIQKIEPPNWWSGMQHDTVKVLLYSDDFSGWKAESLSRNASLLEAKIYPNPRYYSLSLKIRRAGDCKIIFKHKESGEIKTLYYPVLKREKRRLSGIGPEDVVYLLMPDRFADGDLENNDISGHKDPIRPQHRWGRRGGDLQGIIDKLDYLQELGITALWLTPIYQNNYINCYHGYTPTDNYAVEAFLGTMETYRALADSCCSRDIKLIQDHIVNHLAPTHPLALEPPSSEWLNGSLEEHEECNYRIMDVSDIYAPEEVRRKPLEGWFANYLADMNLSHPDVRDYWLYHTIWWIESIGLEGIRQDTYAYSDQDGLRYWAKELKREYPQLFILGEIMEFDRKRLAFFFNDKEDNALSSICDFGLSSEIYQLIVENKPVADFYREIGNDFMYRDPNRMLTFMDNHDMPRFFSAVKGNIRDYLNAFALVFTMRGIPQIYYGNEIGMEGAADPDNRREFPGTFSGAVRNAFEESGRTDKENQIFNQFRIFTAIRKEHPQLFRETMQHDLQKEAYLLRRGKKDSEQLLLTVFNASEKSTEVFYGRLLPGNYANFRVLKDVVSGKMQINTSEKLIQLPGRESTVLLFEK